MNPGVRNTKLLNRKSEEDLQERLQDCYVQEWENDINSSSKLECYCKFKINFKSEIYCRIIKYQKV